MNSNCIFCQIINQKNKDIFWDNQYFIALLDMAPVTPGHFCIIPKRHVVELADLNQKEWESLFTTIKQTKQSMLKLNLKKIYEELSQHPISQASLKFILKALDNLSIFNSPQAFNYGINDGKLAGRTIDHLHIHVIPRYEKDMADPTGGVRHVIPIMGNYKNSNL